MGTTLSGLQVTTDGYGWAVDRPRNWVVNDSAGSSLAWLEYPDQRTDRPELVVYDSDSGSVVSRESIEVAGRNTATLLAIVGRAVFFTEDDRGSKTATATYRYDMDSSAFDRVGAAVVDMARRDVPRALVVGSSADGALLQSPEQETVGENTTPYLLVRNSRLDRLVDPHTGNPVEIAVPNGYEANTLHFTQWLDDDQFAVISSPEEDIRRAARLPDLCGPLRGGGRFLDLGRGAADAGQRPGGRRAGGRPGHASPGVGVNAGGYRHGLPGARLFASWGHRACVAVDPGPFAEPPIWECTLWPSERRRARCLPEQL